MCDLTEFEKWQIVGARMAGAQNGCNICFLESYHIFNLIFLLLQSVSILAFDLK